MHRRIDVARARPQADMRAVLMIMGFFVILFVVTARSYLEPYSTPIGQLVLLLVATIWASGVWLMARMGKRGQIDRFLSGNSDDIAVTRAAAVRRTAGSERADQDRADEDGGRGGREVRP